MTIELDQVKIPLELQKSRRNGISLRVKESPARLVLAHPQGILDAQGRAFIETKKKWILKHFKQLQAQGNKQTNFWERVEQGEILYLGEWYPLKLSRGKSNRAVFQDKKIWIQLDHRADISEIEAIYPALRALAKQHLHKRTLELASWTQSSVNAIRVKDLRSKWGSCSSKSNVNLNWYLIFLSPKLIDYVIIHELMHLRQMNHSPAYWVEVAKYMPGYKQLRKQVHDHQWLIGIFE